MLGQVFCIDSRLVTLYKVGEAHFCLLGTSGFHIKAENGKKLRQKRAARAARLFFIIQPIKSLVFSVGVVLLKDGEVYRAHYRLPLTPAHAETLALNEATLPSNCTNLPFYRK